RGIALDKLVEQFRLHRRVDTDAGVDYSDIQLDSQARQRATAHPDDDPALLGELDRVVHQVDQDLEETTGIPSQTLGQIRLPLDGERQALLGRQSAPQQLRLVETA